MKLVVEVIEASELMPKDGHGSANPYVEVEFAGTRYRTRTLHKDLNPKFSQPLYFSFPNDSNPLLSLADLTIDVSVYHDRTLSLSSSIHQQQQQQSQSLQQRTFLGRVRISGDAVAASASAARIERFPLEKRGIFSRVSGEIALRLYLVQDEIFNNAHDEILNNNSNGSNNSINAQDEILIGDQISESKEKKKKHKDQQVRTFYSVGAEPLKAPKTSPTLQQPFPQPEIRVDKAWFGPPPPGATIVRPSPPAGGPNVPGPAGKPPPEFGLIETSPPLAARQHYRGILSGTTSDKMASTYDLVEQMQFLYVTVVKARDLPPMDVTGSLDPYVEVKLGNYRGQTKHFEKSQNPVFNQVFAFARERLQSNVLEVTVKDKDLVKDDFVGRVLFDLTEVPLRVPPDSPLAPQWYKLEDKHGIKLTRGEIMLSVWMGTQADEAFPDAWHSDAHSISLEGLNHTRSKVYFSPKLAYLRVHIIEAQDLIPAERGRMPDCYAKVQLGGQARRTRPAPVRSVNPIWNEEQLFVASEPFDEQLIVSVEERVGPQQEVPLGRIAIPLSVIPQRADTFKPVEARWFNLMQPLFGEEVVATEKKKEPKFSSKIHLRICLDMGYHVLDESTHYSSDLRPASKHLRKPSIGVLELGILSARNLMPMKKESGSTDSYCVAKYGPKWIRTRTILSSLVPRWNEQYTWEVFDPCTVITIGVFDNCHVHGKNGDARDQRIGKVRIRLSTLQANRVYTHYYPLLVLQPSGLKKTGELHLAVRFTCTAWVNMVALYGKPLLPKMHYVQPIPVLQLDWLRHQAMQIVAARLHRAEPPLRKEVVEYMLDVDSHMWSLRRSKANFGRIMSLLSGVGAIGRWFNSVRNWRNPITTVLVHILFLILVCYPELILPTIFLYLFMIGIWNYRFRPRHPPHMDTRLSHAELASPDELDEEFDTFPSSRPGDIVRYRYDRLRSVGGRVQTVVGDLATQGERAQAILSWRDPRATAIFILFSLIFAVFLYVTPVQVVAVLIGLYLLRHPKFRSRMPSVPYNFYRRLPAKSDMLL